ncbi:Uncharacterised protein [Mycobacteroides abscessus subsp. abscessus]|nr:Uncharacterised protein [Mycobacteroides abscessus subsp. abscessus]
MNTPPRTGPIATESPTIVPMSPNARPRCGPWKYCWRRPTTCGLSRPEPKPMRTRAMLSVSGSGASPATKDEIPKRLTPAMKSWARPKTSPARPAATRTTPKDSA